MGLDKRARAELKAAKEKQKREYRRTEKEWLRNQGEKLADKRYSDECEFDSGFKHRVRETE